jgi:hypothetical protein
MNDDPHIVCLTYRLSLGDQVEFRNPPPVDINTPDFTGRLEDGILTLEPKTHFSTVEDVRLLSDSFAKAWEIAADLTYNWPTFRFDFDGASIIDRNPQQASSDFVVSTHTSFANAPGRFNLKVGGDRYPTPPGSYQITPEIEVIWKRYIAYLQRREPLLSMAYFCLTILAPDNRPAAAKKHSIDIAVLNRLGELTSRRGDRVTARKMTMSTTPLSSEEHRWVEAAIRAIIRHLTFDQAKTLRMTDVS